MEIKEYIRELLFTNQGVIIPGLGGFVSEYESAAFDVNENKFLPPSKKITFNSEYSYKDDLLINFISKKEKIDTENSKKLLKDFVTEIKEILNKGDKIEFPEIGILSKSAKGLILFKQNIESNLLSDSFGLKSIKTKPIVNLQVETETIKPFIQKKSFKKQIIIGLSTLIFVCLVALSWFFTNGYTDFNFISSNEKINTVPFENINKITSERNLDSIAKADSVKALINKSIDKNTDKKDALYYEEPKKESSDSTGEHTKSLYSEFHIIAGSFKRMDNAEKFASELKSKGYYPEIIKSNKNLIRISIYSYTNETEALKKLYKLRKNSEIKSFWILKSI